MIKPPVIEHTVKVPYQGAKLLELGKKENQLFVFKQ
jgi:hypothetical protein